MLNKHKKKKSNVNSMSKFSNFIDSKLHQRNQSILKSKFLAIDGHQRETPAKTAKK